VQLEDTDNFESWEKLVRAAESLEGGLNRNSNPQSIAATRDIYDRFLGKFPLLFGYWKKYADLEFSIAGTEAAELVGNTMTITGIIMALTIIGLRAWCRKYNEFCRPVDQLLCIQSRDMPRRRGHTRVSRRDASFLPITQQLSISS
jgi:hypothetical protein